MLAGLILAGGEGTRWGGPKAWALLPNGESFLDACAMTLREAEASPIVATLPPGAEDPQIDGLDVLVLPDSGMDMFGSFRAGLDRLVEAPTWQVVAVLPVDHPLVRPETVTELAAAAGPAAIPSFKGKHGHPICLARPVAESVARGDVAGPTLREVLRAVGAVSLPVDDPGVVANCNTPAALASALVRLRGRNSQF
ncbi:NTP transferase domain-containing protein [bacterium]|nr:NTP transferase domain-containing protein [bacterium]